MKTDGLHSTQYSLVQLLLQLFSLLHILLEEVELNYIFLTNIQIKPSKFIRPLLQLFYIIINTELGTRHFVCVTASL